MFNTTKKHFYKSTTCICSVFIAADLLVISRHTTSFLVLLGAFQSDVALLGCDIQIPPNPLFQRGGMRTVSLFGQSAVFVPPLKKGGSGGFGFCIAPRHFETHPVLLGTASMPNIW
jgi:hypothetical protein